jgi:hypothetical protein
MGWVWWRWSGSAVFAWYVMLLPVVYGYVGPGIATNLLKKWRFNGPWVVGDFFVHHGFMYAANLAPVLFIAFLGTPVPAASLLPADGGTLAAGTIARILLSTGALYGFMSWINDITLVRLGIVDVFNPPAAAGKSPAEIVTHYAPLCFPVIGVCYAAGALVAFEVFVLRRHVTANAVLVVALAGILPLLVLPTLAYRWTERRRD